MAVILKKKVLSVVAVYSEYTTLPLVALYRKKKVVNTPHGLYSGLLQ